MKPISDCRILLVDDTKANLDILVAGLKSDYKLNVALNGEAALQLAAQVSFDLILLDVMMPGLDGYEVCRRLRADPATRDVPVVFVSALHEITNKALGFEVGGNDYITKPFDLVEVKSRVRSLLKAKAYNDAAKEQIAGELRVAREIQMGMVPQDFAELGRQYGVDIAARLLPAGQVGGDLFAAFGQGPDRLVLVMGDVSGKGVPAALFMVRTLSLIRLLARDIHEPARILARLNDELAADNPSSMFATLVCASYEPASRRLILASGGQTSPILVPAAGVPHQLSDRLGTALGLEPGLEFTRTVRTLEPGDTVVFYTDGITEAFNRSGQCYSGTRFLADLGALSGHGPETVTTGILERIHAFADGRPQSDDIAVLLLRVPEPATELLTSPYPGVCLQFHATRQEVMRAVEAVRAFGREQDLDEQQNFAVALAVEECASNIVRHACRDETQRFSVSCKRTPDALTVLLSDQGAALDPGILRGAPGECADDSGGWGLHLAMSFVDDLEYRREADRNVWRITKRVPALEGRSVNPQAALTKNTYVTGH